MGSSVYSFADIYNSAEDDKYVYGDPSATCPDVNSWTQVTFLKGVVAIQLFLVTYWTNCKTLALISVFTLVSQA